MLHIINFFLLTIVTLSSEVKVTVPVKVLRIEKFNQCPGKENLTINYKDVILSQTRQNVIDVSAKIIISSTIDRNISAIIELYKCSAKGEDSTCEYYTRIKINQFCDQSEKWGNYVQFSDLPPNCPVPKGNYTVDHAIIDLNSVKQLPLFIAYWKTSFSVVQQHKMLGCINAEFSIEEKLKRVDV